jgi:hypothetical protein
MDVQAQRQGHCRWRQGSGFFISDLLHHYMEVGLLRGTKERAEGICDDAEDSDGATLAAVEPVATEI